MWRDVMRGFSEVLRDGVHWNTFCVGWEAVQNLLWLVCSNRIFGEMWVNFPEKSIDQIVSEALRPGNFPLVTRSSCFICCMRFIVNWNLWINSKCKSKFEIKSWEGDILMKMIFLLWLRVCCMRMRPETFDGGIYWSLTKKLLVW